VVVGSTKKHNERCPAWHEEHEAAETAIQREKQITIRERVWKLKFIGND
jgi:predicted GIY-YIG superfamily endonuclease